jgi:hypothetical protein
MNRRSWLPIAIILLVLAALATTYLLPRFHSSPTSPVTSTPTLLVASSPTSLATSSPTPPPPTIAWEDLPTVTPPGLGEPTLLPEALAMYAAPTATPGVPSLPLPSAVPKPTVTPFPTPVSIS